MNLLDTASLVVTPNGYKASKLYSIVPSDGTGDMTFARTGDTATRVNSSGLIETVLANKPRLDYTSSTCPKLLLEPQRTNLLAYSDQFDNAYWAKDGVTVTPNTNISPDGTQNADSIIATGSSYTNVNRNITLTTGTSYTYSIFVKKSNYRYINLYSYQTRNGESANFYDFDTNTVNNTIVPSTPLSFVNYPNGWVRLSLTFTPSSASQYFIINMCNSSGYNLNTTPANSTVYTYGAQVEAGAYATSYIPTTTASVTRNAETCNKDSATALIGQTEGVVYADFNLQNTTDEQQLFYMRSGAGVYANLISIYVGGDKKIYVYVATSTTQFSYTTSPVYSLGKHKVALAYKTNDFAVYIDGVQKSTSSSGSLPSLDRIKLGNYDDGGVRCALLNNVALWKTRLTNQELVTLTTI